jgi:branched-chain amino acid transport system substrate-binding protein
MSYSVVLRIIGGSFREGYDIQAEIRHDRKILCTESGHLPPKPEISQLYEKTFPAHYANWGSRSNWGERVIQDGDGIESIKACVNTAKELEQLFQNWMQYAKLGDIYTGIIREIPCNSHPLFILEAPGNLTIQRLPWHNWEWLNKAYPGTEVVLSRKAFPVEISQKQLRILVILGSEENIDLKADWAALENNLKSIAELLLLKQPDFHQLCDQIRLGCDILFFAGHSDSNEKSGWIKINEHQTIDINDLIPELRVAVNKGMKMVFMNSCSGLGIASQLAEINVPYIVAMREPIHNDVAAKFIEHCLSSLAKGSSLTSAVSSTRIALKRLENKYICASWMPIIFQSREAADYIPFPEKPEKLHKRFPLAQLVIQLLWNRKIMKVSPIILLAVGLSLSFLIYKLSDTRPPLDISPLEVSESIGDQDLFTTRNSPSAKQEGIKAFSRKDYTKAINQFTMSLKSKRNDPETVIYMNNARILSQSPDFKNLQIIPVINSAKQGSSTAIEVLSGAAIAQVNINKQGGIQGKKVILKIILDDSDDKKAEKVAEVLVNDPSIKGVVGHVDSNTSIAAARIYQREGLVMISPTSSTMDLRDSGEYIFRTVPNSKMMVSHIVDYISKATKSKKIGFCFDSKLTAGKTFKDEFIKQFNGRGRTALLITCDASNKPFSAQQIIQKMVREKADGLFLYYHLNEDYQIEAAKDLAQAAQAVKLPLFGSHSLVAVDILASGKDFEGMTVVTPRHPDQSLASNFSNLFQETFGNKPNWREMTGYDAVKAIAVGLDKSDGTRKGLQQKLHEPNFSIPDGSSGPIKFSQSGDRAVTSSIAQVECPSNSQCRFKLISEALPKSNLND